jgi:phosphohistidine phosphatase
MELYFFRHGDAEPVRPGGPDGERQLSERGRDDVQAVARALSRAGVQPQAIFTSPLLRAGQTGQILAEQLAAGERSSAALLIAVEPVKGLGPGCRLGDVQALLADRALDRVMLVGHEPDVSMIVGDLIGGGSVRLQTSAVARVDADSIAPGEGVLVWLLAPALVGRAGAGGGR